MGEGTGQSDNTPRPDDATVIGGDATVIGGEAGGMPAGPMPETIAGYAIKGAIGAGGMGSVYLAQQDSPKRDVAIKVMNAGVVSRKAMRRFEFEAQTLGKLQHPSIAQIYEAGTYDDGSGARPFFAMEYVAGAKELNDYVADNDIDQRTRLELFCAACEGVEYGHRRGVIHRDLKPGNILVDEVGNPKIIDFGVARSTDSDSVSATLATEAGQLIGTLQYMSPEQVELDPGELDTRSDVYALGVMLYELLVDRMPYDLTGTSLTQAASRIREIQPRRLGEINASLKGDLETICLKALEKDREQRYQSVNDLAEDVRRYLSDEPIMARPPTRTEQIRRFVRKNKAASIATCVAGTALIGLLLVLILFAVGAMLTVGTIKKQRDAAEQARQYADTQRTLAEEKTAEVQKQAEEMQVMVNFQARQLSGINVTAMGASLKERMIEQFEVDADASAGVDFTGSSLALLNEHIFAPTLDRINEQFADQPLVQARLLQAMAYTLRRLGLLAESMSPQTRALELRVAELGREDPATLESINRMGDLLASQGKYDEAMPYYTEALETGRRTLGNEHSNTLWAINRIGVLLQSQGKYDEAMPYLAEALEVCRRTLGDEHNSTLGAISSMGSLLSKQGKYDEAMPYYTEALETGRRTLGNEHSNTLLAISRIGVLLSKQGKYDEAMPYYTEALEAYRRTLGNAHPSTLMSINCMGSLLLKQG